jgi:hypothetical protein
MKCVYVFRERRVRRLEDGRAAELVRVGAARYASKGEWREQKEEDRQEYAVNGILASVRGVKEAV